MWYKNLKTIYDMNNSRNALAVWNCGFGVWERYHLGTHRKGRHLAKI